jgi:hypothetical protein
MSDAEREWRVMRFENAEGKYAEVGTYLGANTIPVPPGYKLVSSTPMVPASQLAGAVEKRDRLAAAVTTFLNRYERGDVRVDEQIVAMSRALRSKP